MDSGTATLSGIWTEWASYSNDIQEAIINGLEKNLNGLGKKARKEAKEQVQKAIEQTQTEWSGIDWRVSAIRYQHQVQEIYGTIKILGKPEPVSLEGIFTDVMILETPTALRRFDIKLLGSNPEELSETGDRKDGLGLVKSAKNSRLFILGKPGAGKTTFLKYLTIKAVKGELDKIPIFVSLKEWADSGFKLMEFLAKQFEVCNFPNATAFLERILEKGDALLLFDGLDEVNQEGRQRAKMITDLRNFSNRYSGSQSLVTCRIAATEYAFDRFTYLELADFTDKQVKTFVKKWFKGSPKKRRLFEDAFGRPENKGLRELARIPLLLSLLCLSFDATLEFPQRRVEIYEEALEALLKKWDATRSIKRDEIYRGLSLGRKRQMFARIAAQTFQNGKYFLSQAALSKQIVSYLRQLPGLEPEDEIDGDVVLKAIEAQHGIFTERAHRIYSFAHLTFQEYFTAKQIVADTTGKALRVLLTTQNLTDDRWREVILLTVSLLDNADDFFEAFMLSLDKLAAKEPLLVGLLGFVKQKTEAHSEAAPALRSYYCYLIFSLLIEPSFSNPYNSSSISSSLSFASNYSASHLIDICFGLAVKLDRSHSLNEAITANIVADINVAREELASGKYSGLESLSGVSPTLGDDIAIHLSYAFFFALTIMNLRNLLNVQPMIASLRSYFVELRRYATPLTVGEVATAIRDLAIPADTSAESAWISLIDKIRGLVVGVAGPGKFFADAQRKSVITFFVAVRLFVDCLSLAVLSDRSTGEGRLLLPPAR